MTKKGHGKKSSKGGHGRSQEGMPVWRPKGASSLPRSQPGFATSARMTLRYTDQNQLNVSSGGWIILNANGPNSVYNSKSSAAITGLENRKPGTWDVQKLFYNTYRVMSTRIKVTATPFWPTSVAGAVAGFFGCVWGIYPTDTMAGPTGSINDATVQRGAKYKVLAPGPSTPSQSISMRMNTAQINGISEATVLTNSAYAAPTAGTTVPVDLWGYCVFVQALGGAFNTSVTFYYELEYDVIFEAPYNFANSDALITLDHARAIVADADQKKEETSSEPSGKDEVQEDFVKIPRSAFPQLLEELALHKKFAGVSKVN